MECIKSKKKVLFLDIDNAARSQMAEAYLCHYASRRYEAASAGLAPTQLHPLAIKVMAEDGIDISQQQAKQLEDVSHLFPVDTVITVCSQAQLARMWTGYTPGRTPWMLEDPQAARGRDQLEAFRRVRDAIKSRILFWLHMEELEADEKFSGTEVVSGVAEVSFR